jgi:MFS family permease
VIFESFVQIFTDILRNRGILNVRWATIIGGIICGIVAYLWLAQSSTIWTAYASYAILGGIGSGMVYSSAINIVAKWYPERKGWRTGFVNGGWAYGAVPFIFVIGAGSSPRLPRLNTSATWASSASPDSRWPMAGSGRSTGGCRSTSGAGGR